MPLEVGMRKYKGKSILNVLLYVIQFLLIFTIIILEYLSDKKMGVMRSLVYRNKVLRQSLFSVEMFKFYSIIFIFGIVVIAGFLLTKLFKYKDLLALKRYGWIVILFVAGIIFICSSKIKGFNAYYFFLLVIFINIFLEASRILFLKITNR